MLAWEGRAPAHPPTDWDSRHLGGDLNDLKLLNPTCPPPRAPLRQLHHQLEEPKSGLILLGHGLPRAFQRRRALQHRARTRRIPLPLRTRVPRTTGLPWQTDGLISILSLSAIGIALLLLRDSNAATAVVRRQTRAGNLLPHPDGARRKQLYPIPLPKTSGDFVNLKF